VPKSCVAVVLPMIVTFARRAPPLGKQAAAGQRPLRMSKFGGFPSRSCRVPVLIAGGDLGEGTNLGTDAATPALRA